MFVGRETEERRWARWQLQAGSALLGTLFCLTQAVAETTPESGLDLVYAEDARLATESLLLDVTRTESGRLIAVGERGHVILSDDGETWRQAEHVPTRSTLTTVTASGPRLWAAGHDTVILTSADGGETWTLLNFEPDRQQPVLDIHFFDERHGLAIGAYGLAMLTEDGGASWDEPLVSADEWHLNAVADLGDGRLMIAGEAGFSYRSFDRGETWEPLEMPYQGSMFGGIVFGGFGSTDCVLVFGLRGNAQQTCDFGETWVELDTGTEATLAGGSRRGDEQLLVGNSGAVLTRVGTQPFDVELHASGVDFSAVLPLDERGWLLVGEGGFHRYPQNETAQAR